MGIALTMYGREEEADPLIESLQVSLETLTKNFFKFSAQWLNVNLSTSRC